MIDVKKKGGYPSNSPIDMPNAHCYGCGNRLRLVFDKLDNGKITGLKGYCDPCENGYEISYRFVDSTPVKYVPAGQKAAQAKTEPSVILAGGR